MNEYTLKDLFEFANDIANQSSNCFIASLNEELLSTNVPLDETIETCIDELFKSEMRISDLRKSKCLKCFHYRSYQRFSFRINIR